MLAWGNSVSPEFRVKTRQVCQRVHIIDPSWLMACMAFETGRTFAPFIRNAAGSGAVGLIQFMPSTATALGTTTEKLGGMNAVDQLEYVERYFLPWKGKLNNLGDVYGAILWPGMIGKADDYIVFDAADGAHPARYMQNRGLDTNHDGKITKIEVTATVQRFLDQGLQPPNVYEDLIS